MNILVPQGIGDTLWAVTKLKSLAAAHDGVINLKIAVEQGPTDPMQTRAQEYLSRFSFIDSVDAYPCYRHPTAGSCILRPGPYADTEGRYRYIEEGFGVSKDYPGIDAIMIPNGHLERGKRLEDWWPHLAIDWNIMQQFENNQAEQAFVSRLPEQYAVFFLGAESSNTYNGHNRGHLWRAEEWAELGQILQTSYALPIVVVGAPYDRSYYETWVRPHITGAWIDLIGSTSMPLVVEILRKAKVVVSFQSGVGISASYLGIPTAIFWRPRGDSISPDFLLSFDQAMCHCWANPAHIQDGRHLGLIYGWCSPKSIVEHFTRYGWL